MSLVSEIAVGDEFALCYDSSVITVTSILSDRMLFHFVACAMVVAPVPATAKGNPFQHSKVGDFATFKRTITVAGTVPVVSTITHSVTAKSDKEVTIKSTGTVKGKETPSQECKYDLSKPFDPSKLFMNTLTDAKVEVLKSDVENLKLQGKECEAVWTTYRVRGKANTETVTMNIKLWVSKDVPGLLAEIEYTMEFSGTKIEVRGELIEVGRK